MSNLVQRGRGLFRRFGQSLVALGVAGLTALASGLTDNHMTAPEGVQVAIAVTTAAGVWLVPNLPGWPWVKTGLAMLLAGLNFLVTIIDHGITYAEGVNLALAVLGVIAVGVAPSISTSASPPAPTAEPPGARAW